MIDLPLVAGHGLWIVGLATMLAAASAATGPTRHNGLVGGAWLTAAGMTTLYAGSVLAWTSLAIITTAAWRARR